MNKDLFDFTIKEKLLRICLKRLSDQYINAFKGKTEEIYLKLQHEKKQNNEDILIEYNDFFRRIMVKLENSMMDKNSLHNLNNYISETTNKSLKTVDRGKLKKQFDEICNYKLKSDKANLYYSDKSFCQYVASKTFKKTMNEVYSFLYYSFDVNKYCLSRFGTEFTESLCDEKKLQLERDDSLIYKDDLQTIPTIPNWKFKQLHIASIGGGPGNDALGVYLYLKSAGLLSKSIQRPVKLNVFDLSFKGWESAFKETLSSFYKEELLINWDYTNHQEEYDLGQLKADFITICWTLNENLAFNKQYWNSLIKKNKDAVYVVIEGERKNVDKLVALFKEHGMKNIYYESKASPRRVIAHI